VVFWVVAQCSVVVGYQSFGGPCCIHLQAARSSETLVSYHFTLKMEAKLQNWLVTNRSKASLSTWKHLKESEYRCSSFYELCVIRI